MTDPDTASTTWRHARSFEPHKAQPDLSLRYIQRGTGNTEAPCLTCGEAVILRAPDTAGTDPLVTVVAEAFGQAAVNGRIPSTREPLPFLSLADIAVTAVRAHQNTTDRQAAAQALRDAAADLPAAFGHRKPAAMHDLDVIVMWLERRADALNAAGTANPPGETRDGAP